MCRWSFYTLNYTSLSKVDKSASYDLNLQSFSAIDELSEQPYKDMFKTTTNKTLVTLKIKRARHIMKRPVVERIEGHIEPFILSISIPFIKELVSIFPSVEELKTLDLDNDDNDESSTPLSQSSNTKSAPRLPLISSPSTGNLQQSGSSEIQTVQAQISPQSSDKQPTDGSEIQTSGNQEGAIFCREFILHPFTAQLNFRRKYQGAFREFLGRPFNYPGLHMYDIFGTEDQLISFVKKNVKWTAIKALPNFLLGKGKKGPAQPKQQLPKPKDMEPK